jgi:hypothetical protein
MNRTGRFGQVKSGDGVAGNARCAGAENGQASAAPPRSGMNSRRLKGLIRMCPVPHLPVRGPHRILFPLKTDWTNLHKEKQCGTSRRAHAAYTRVVV